jgi:hypothetical protein
MYTGKRGTTQSMLKKGQWQDDRLVLTKAYDGTIVGHGHQWQPEWWSVVQYKLGWWTFV